MQKDSAREVDDRRDPTRRDFINRTSGAAALLGVAAGPALTFAQSDSRPALLGGKPVRTELFPSWPRLAANDHASWNEVLEKGKWCRIDGDYATRFEQVWAKALGAKRTIATSSGTTALITCLNVLDVGPGDEVIVPPYTFVATINAVLLQHAMPVFVDTDRQTFQIDAAKIERAITPRTRCILPVHLGGSPADMDRVLAIGAKHKLPVLEDACQAHLAEWNHRKVGTLGALGCFSFQASKNLNSGEGGAISGNDEHLLAECRSFHNNGRGAESQYARNGSNHRMTEFQAALLLTQFTRLEEQSRTREQNAGYLTSLLKEIPGIRPARPYSGCTRNAYHLYMLRYDPAAFSGLPRDKFLKALEAEGVPCSSGYTPLNKEPFIGATLKSRHFRKVFSESEIAHHAERTACPENDRLCGEAVWFTQTMLLGPRRDMDQIAEAIRKIQKHAGALNNA